MSQKKVFCQLSKKEVPINQAIHVGAIRSTLIDIVKRNHPDFDEKGYVSLSELNKLRSDHIKKLLEADQRELSKLEKEVLDSVSKDELLSMTLNQKLDEQLSFGEKLSDKLAAFGGSWKFIILFGMLLLLWIITNTIILINKPFDPYPFVFLNLILSCIAALQAPVIMMSQNRMEEKDRQRASNDYMINLKAELEIRQLHEKMDHLIRKQMEHLNEIQQIQIDILNEIVQNTKSNDKK